MIKRVRIVYQFVLIAVFFLLLIFADYDRSTIIHEHFFLEIDPLVFIGISLSNFAIYGGLAGSFIIILISLFFGRFFCSWICPLGTLQDVCHVQYKKNLKNKIEKNRYRKAYITKYLLLIVLLLTSLLGTSQLLGLFDPIVLLTRSVVTAVFPSLDFNLGIFSVHSQYYQLGWISLSLLLSILVVAVFFPRTWCRLLCPLGALLGLLSFFSIFRIRRNDSKCTNCGLCTSVCNGAADPDKNHRNSECILCMNCKNICPENAISFALPKKSSPENKFAEHINLPEINRRTLISTLAAGSLFALSQKAKSIPLPIPSETLIRPPGALAEVKFLNTCIKCDLCMKVCPTNVIQPVILKGGLASFWTPSLDYQIGHCEYTCTKCSEVCPTQAIKRISIEEKLGTGQFAGNPIKIGTAFINRSLCIPYTQQIPCLVCQEVCPTSPKAIYTVEVSRTSKGQQNVKIARPIVDASTCIGCGICQRECPVNYAIYVTSSGK